MYICYDKLWKLLLERNIRKTEMSEVAGLNSRTLAKLSKNEKKDLKFEKNCAILSKVSVYHASSKWRCHQNGKVRALWKGRHFRSECFPFQPEDQQNL